MSGLTYCSVDWPERGEEEALHPSEKKSYHMMITIVSPEVPD